MRELPFVPRGLSRVEAARYVGISPTKFDQLVGQGTMPAARVIGRRKVFDRIELDLAFDRLPSDDDKNDWD